MSRRAALLAVVLTILFGATAMFWNQAQPEMAAYDSLSKLVRRPDVIAAVSNANVLPGTDMKMLDLQWRREGGAGPMTDALMSTALSRQLALDRIASDGAIAQIMVMDRRGALVAADHPTHDYDQSDEPKWLRTIGSDTRGAVFEGSDKTGRAKVDQLSQAIVGAEGRIIGAVTLRWCGSDTACR